jgi:hypothetical protein
VTITKVDKMVGLWKRVNPESLSRVYSHPNEAVWADGQPRPMGQHNQQDISAVRYQTVRVTETDTVGDLAREQSQYPIREITTSNLAHRMMVRRAVALYAKTLSTDYYLSDHTATVAAIAGSSVTWANATGSAPYIFNSLMYAAATITKKTLGAVQFADLTLVLSPVAAYKAAATEEIRNYLAQSPDALAQIRGNKPGQNASWGLPDTLYGMKLEVDPTIQNLGQRLGTASNGFLASDTKAMILCRPGDTPDNATQFSSAFSSWHLFSYAGEEMMAEEFNEPIHRRTIYSVTDNFVIEPVAPETSFLLTSIF